MDSSALLPFVHPAIGALGLGAGLLTLRQGLALRDARRHREPVGTGFRRHLTLARFCTVCVAVGALTGPLSVATLRTFAVASTWHGKLGLAAAALFIAQWLLGRTLLKGAKERRGTHAVLGLVAVFLGGIAALLGIELLP